MHDDSISDAGLWKFVTDEKCFEDLRTNKAFAALVALSRAVNTLRFVQNPLLCHEGHESPAASRARLNSIFFSCAIYAESYLLVQHAKSHFWSLPLFQELEGVTIKNDEAKKLLSWSLTALRNKLVFHFDIDEIGRQLEQMDGTDPTFLEAAGETNDQVHYVLADRCAWKTLHEPLLSKAGAGESPTLEQLSNDISDRIIEFTDAAEKFIADTLKTYGWYRAPST